MLIDVRCNDPQVNGADARQIERSVAVALGFARRWIQQVTVRLDRADGAGDGGAGDGRPLVSCRVVVRCREYGYLTSEAADGDPMAALDRNLARLRRDLKRRLGGDGPAAAAGEAEGGRAGSRQAI